jgi:hypothetical protein
MQLLSEEQIVAECGLCVEKVHARRGDGRMADHMGRSAGFNLALLLLREGRTRPS